MVAAMALLTHNNYLSRIGALWPTPINALLNLDPPFAVVLPLSD